MSSIFHKGTRLHPCTLTTTLSHKATNVNPMLPLSLIKPLVCDSVHFIVQSAGAQTGGVSSQRLEIIESIYERIFVVYV